MPPIKRTKFKLAPEQLLEMFYWLRLIRAFDERLSILVRQGKVRSGVYTGIGHERATAGRRQDQRDSPREGGRADRSVDFFLPREPPVVRKSQSGWRFLLILGERLERIA